MAEGGFEVARAYARISPDSTGFAEELKAQLERIDVTFIVPAEPDASGFQEKLRAQLGEEPPVEVPVQPDAAGFDAKLAAAIAGSQALAGGGIKVPVNAGVGTDFGAAELGRLARYLNDTFGLIVNSSDQVMMSSGRLGQLNRSLADSFGLIRSQAATAALSERQLAAANENLTALYPVRLSLEQRLNAALLDGAAASRTVAAATGGAGGAAAGAAATFRLWGLGIGLTTTAIHGLVSGGIEFLAVAIPAAVAAGAWAAVWSQGAQNVQQHMTALYTATEATHTMFGQTVGDVLGLGHALQTAQNAANPNVYTALGAALLAAKTQAGGLATAGLQVGQAFDEFAAKVVFDLRGAAGGQVAGLLKYMTTDLIQLGQVAGNTGHALLNLASAMPGLAQILLDVVDGASRLAEFLTSMPTQIITAVFALHEFNTWGSVLVRTLGLASAEATAAAGSFFGFGRAAFILRNVMGVIPSLITNIGTGMVRAGDGLGRFGTRIGLAGDAVAGFGAESSAAIAGLSTGWVVAIAAAAVGLGILIDKAVTARSATQQWVDALQAAASQAKDTQVLGVLAQNIAEVSVRAKVAAQDMAALRGAALQGGMIGQYAEAASRFNTLNASLKSQAQQYEEITAHVHTLASAYHTSLYGALVLAQDAGVKLDNALSPKQWAIAQIQVEAFARGLGAMGQGAGAVGADMTALAIQSGLAGTKVSQLNSAWDQFQSNMTGGTSGLAAFDQALTNLSTGTNRVTNILGRGGNVTLAIKSFATDLTTFTGKGAAAWQNFNQIVGNTAPQLIDWLRIAGAEGTISGTKFSHGVLDMIAPLIPLASRSKVAQAELLALAQQAGLNIQDFPHLKQAIDSSGASAKNLASIVSAATIAMGSMSTVASNLGTVMNSQVTSSMAAAALKAYGFSQGVDALASAIRRYGANSPQAAAAASTLAGIMDRVNKTLSAMPGLVANAQSALNSMHGKTIYMNTVFSTSGSGQPTGSPLYGPGAPGHVPLHPAGGGVIPGYAPGIDDVHVVASKGEAIMVPEFVRAVGVDRINAWNRHYSGGRKSSPGFMAGGGIAMDARFGFPMDYFNITVFPTGLLQAGGLNEAGQDLAKKERARLLALERAQVTLANTTAHGIMAYSTAQRQALGSWSSLSTIASGQPLNAAGQPIAPTGRSIEVSLAGKLARLRRFLSLVNRMHADHISRGLIGQVIALGPDQGVQYAEAILHGGSKLWAELNREERLLAGTEAAFGNRAAEIAYGLPISKGFAYALKTAEVEAELKKFGAKAAEEFAKKLRVALADVPGLLEALSDLPPSHRHRRHRGAGRGDVTIHQNYYGPQHPTPEQRAQMHLDLATSVGSRL